VRKLIATTALALVIGGPAVAQQQQQDQQTQQPGQDQQMQQQAGQDQVTTQDQQMMAGQGFYQPQPNDMFVSDLMDAEVYAPAQDAQQQQQQQQGTATTAPQDQQQQDQAAAQDADDGAEVTVQVEDAEGDTAQETITTEGQADTDAQVATETDTDQQQMQQDQAATDQQQMQQDQVATDQQRMRQPGEGLQTRAITQDELQGMENIGSVNDVIIDEQGEIRAVVIDAGGFLGIGAREVALSTDQIEFGYDQQNPDQFYVVTQVTAQELENAPEFNRDQLRQQREQDAGMAQDQQQDAAVVGTGQQQQQQQPATQDQAAAQPGVQQDQQWRGDRQALAAPQMQREGFQQAEAAEITADNLLGANVYDVNDENIGSVNDVVMGPEGQAQYAVIDIGGFLGLGTHTVAIGFEELQVLHDEGWADLRVYVDATQEELENMPEYDGTAVN
jgi:sporulation protein YlmC with PRC-barrel domain